MKLVTQRGEKQEYRDEDTGRTFYSVTQVRKVALDPYVGLSEDVLEPARVRGSILHRRQFFIFAALEGLCKYPAVIAGLEGYCASMDQWIEKRKPTRVLVETPSCNLRYGYAGTPDALLNLYLHKKWRKVLFDLKTGAPVRTDPMQLCSYEHMDGYKADELLDVYLDAKGGEAKESFVTKGQRATEWAAFCNAISLLRWRDSL
jgi:hypothetical protein